VLHFGIMDWTLGAAVLTLLPSIVLRHSYGMQGSKGLPGSVSKTCMIESNESLRTVGSPPPMKGGTMKSGRSSERSIPRRDDNRVCIQCEDEATVIYVGNGIVIPLCKRHFDATMERMK
jgi:hypothetical protein